MAMNRENLLGAMKLKTEEIEIDGETVIVSEIGSGDYIKLWSDPKNQKKDEEGKDIIDMSRFTPALISYSVVDESGNRVFTDDDIDTLARSAQGPFMKIAEVARRLNGLTGEEAKNSDDNQPELPSIASA